MNIASRPVVGVICEYDPFHRGHARQLELIRRELPDALILCVMSGCFTQRGAPALFAPAFRTEASLTRGADVVLELPCAFAVRDAERFALGGVSLLNALNCITHISFGAEDDIDTLLPAARLLEAPDAELDAALRRGLDSGLSHAAARGQALADRLPDTAEAVRKPNNILAICYLRALMRLNSDIKPLAVKREGDYHDISLSGERDGGSPAYPSATAVRAAYLRGDIAAATEACGYKLPEARDSSRLYNEVVHRPEALDALLLDTLRTADPQALAALPDCSEGLHNRLYACAREATSREELLKALKTKRYSHARLSRLCTHALLGVTEETLDKHPTPEYARILGFRKHGAGLLTALKRGGLPLFSRGKDGNPDNPLLQLDERAYELWALGARLPAGLWHRQQTVVIMPAESDA